MESSNGHFSYESKQSVAPIVPQFTSMSEFSSRTHVPGGSTSSDVSYGGGVFRSSVDKQLISTVASRSQAPSSALVPSPPTLQTCPQTLPGSFPPLSPLVPRASHTPSSLPASAHAYSTPVFCAQQPQRHTASSLFLRELPASPMVSPGPHAPPIHSTPSGKLRSTEVPFSGAFSTTYSSAVHTPLHQPTFLPHGHMQGQHGCTRRDTSALPYPGMESRGSTGTGMGTDGCAGARTSDDSVAAFKTTRVLPPSPSIASSLPTSNPSCSTPLLSPLSTSALSASAAAPISHTPAIYTDTRTDTHTHTSIHAQAHASQHVPRAAPIASDASAVQPLSSQFLSAHSALPFHPPAHATLAPPSVSTSSSSVPLGHTHSLPHSDSLVAHYTSAAVQYSSQHVQYASANAQNTAGKTQCTSTSAAASCPSRDPALPPVCLLLPSLLRAPVVSLYMRLPPAARRTLMYVLSSVLGSALFLALLGALYSVLTAVVGGSLRVWAWSESGGDGWAACWWGCDVHAIGVGMGHEQAGRALGSHVRDDGQLRAALEGRVSDEEWGWWRRWRASVATEEAEGEEGGMLSSLMSGVSTLRETLMGGTTVAGMSETASAEEGARVAESSGNAGAEVEGRVVETTGARDGNEEGGGVAKTTMSGALLGQSVERTAARVVRVDLAAGTGVSTDRHDSQTARSGESVDTTGRSSGMSTVDAVGVDVNTHARSLAAIPTATATVDSATTTTPTTVPPSTSFPSTPYSTRTSASTSFTPPTSASAPPGAGMGDNRAAVGGISQSIGRETSGIDLDAISSTTSPTTTAATTTATTATSAASARGASRSLREVTASLAEGARSLGGHGKYGASDTDTRSGRDGYGAGSIDRRGGRGYGEDHGVLLEYAATPHTPHGTSTTDASRSSAAAGSSGALGPFAATRVLGDTARRSDSRDAGTGAGAARGDVGMEAIGAGVEDVKHSVVSTPSSPSLSASSSSSSSSFNELNSHTTDTSSSTLDVPPTDVPAESASSPFLFSLSYAVAYLTSVFWQHHLNRALMPADGTEVEPEAQEEGDEDPEKSVGAGLGSGSGMGMSMGAGDVELGVLGTYAEPDTYNGHVNNTDDATNTVPFATTASDAGVGRATSASAGTGVGSSTAVCEDGVDVDDGRDGDDIAPLPLYDVSESEADTDAEIGLPLLSRGAPLHLSLNTHTLSTHAPLSVLSPSLASPRVEDAGRHADISLRYVEGLLHAYSAYTAVLVLVMGVSYVATSVLRMDVGVVTVVLMPVSTVCNYLALQYGLAVMRGTLYWVLYAWHWSSARFWHMRSLARLLQRLTRRTVELYSQSRSLSHSLSRTHTTQIRTHTHAHPTHAPVYAPHRKNMVVFSQPTFFPTLAAESSLVSGALPPTLTASVITNPSSSSSSFSSSISSSSSISNTVVSNPHPVVPSLPPILPTCPPPPPAPSSMPTTSSTSASTSTSISTSAAPSTTSATSPRDDSTLTGTIQAWLVDRAAGWSGASWGSAAWSSRGWGSKGWGGTGAVATVQGWLRGRRGASVAHSRAARGSVWADGGNDREGRGGVRDGWSRGGGAAAAGSEEEEGGVRGGVRGLQFSMLSSAGANNPHSHDT